MLRSLSSDEYGEMLAEWTREPRAERRADLQAAAISAWTLAPHTKSHVPPPLEDVCLKFEPKQTKAQTVEEQVEICRQIAMRCNPHGR